MRKILRTDFEKARRDLVLCRQITHDLQGPLEAIRMLSRLSRSSSVRGDAELPPGCGRTGPKYHWQNRAILCSVFISREWFSAERCKRVGREKFIDSLYPNLRSVVNRYQLVSNWPGNRWRIHREQPDNT
jgi:hypothetical protein